MLSVLYSNVAVSVYTVELSELNQDRIEDYVSQSGLSWRLFRSPPDYNFGLVVCNREQAVWLELLA